MACQSIGRNGHPDGQESSTAVRKVKMVVLIRLKKMNGNAIRASRRLRAHYLDDGKELAERAALTGRHFILREYRDYRFRLAAPSNLIP
jgi:hypothetical protein